MTLIGIDTSFLINIKSSVFGVRPSSSRFEQNSIRSADRIEFCSNLDEDGLTPKTDDLILIKKLVSIPIRVMIRPHSKSFVYNEMDIEIMKNTIDLCKQHDFDGVVFGLSLIHI